MPIMTNIKARATLVYLCWNCWEISRCVNSTGNCECHWLPFITWLRRTYCLQNMQKSSICIQPSILLAVFPNVGRCYTHYLRRQLIIKQLWNMEGIITTSLARHVDCCNSDMNIMAITNHFLNLSLAPQNETHICHHS